MQGSSFRRSLQTSHVLNGKPIAFPVKRVILLIDCIVAIREVNSGLFIKSFCHKPTSRLRFNSSASIHSVSTTENHQNVIVLDA